MGFYDFIWLLGHAVGSVMVIFAVYSIIDLIRIKFVEYPFLDWRDKHEEQYLNVLNHDARLKERKCGV